MTLCQDKKLTLCQNDLPEQNLENVAVFPDENDFDAGSCFLDNDLIPRYGRSGHDK